MGLGTETMTGDSDVGLGDRDSGLGVGTGICPGDRNKGLVERDMELMACPGAEERDRRQ